MGKIHQMVNPEDRTERFYPRTLEEAVVDLSGNSLSSKLGVLAASASTYLADSASLKNAAAWIGNNSASIVTESVWVRGEGPSSAVLSGSDSSATGLGAVAEGISTTASGYTAHAEGEFTTASGNYSHAEGRYTKASGQGSHAEGLGTTTLNRWEHAQGTYNATASSQIFSVGVGNLPSSRKNAVSIITGSGEQSSASIYIYGVGGYDGTNPTPGTNDLATIISSLTGSQGGLTSESDPFFAAKSASLEASASLAATAIQPSVTSSWATAAANSHTHSNKTVLDNITAAKTASWDGKQDTITDLAAIRASASLAGTNGAWITSNSGSIHTHTNKAVLDGITAAKTASWEASGTLAKNLTAISASLIASGTLAKNVTAITASLVASASVAKTASSSAAAISAKTGSWDAFVGLPAVTAADNGKILRVVNGAWALVDPVTIYSGQGTPAQNLGTDGDIYLQS